MAQSLNLDDLLGQIPLGDIAERFGVDEDTANAAVRQALPGLLGGLAVNASDNEGAGKLEKALERHVDSGAKGGLVAIDTDDGEKIVNHVLGDKKSDVVQALGAQSGSSGIADLIPKLLPILAPIIMQFLAGGFSKQQADPDDNGGIGDLLGGLLGGGSQQSGGGLGDLLGGLLGGGSQQSGGGLGGLLGGLLGGNR